MNLRPQNGRIGLERRSTPSPRFPLTAGERGCPPCRIEGHCRVTGSRCAQHKAAVNGWSSGIRKAGSVLYAAFCKKLRYKTQYVAGEKMQRVSHSRRKTRDVPE
jgi:hypothetical protein